MSNNTPLIEKNKKMERGVFIFWFIVIGPFLGLVFWILFLAENTPPLLASCFVFSIMLGYAIYFPIRLIIEMYLIEAAGKVARKSIEKIMK